MEVGLEHKFDRETLGRGVVEIAGDVALGVDQDGSAGCLVGNECDNAICRCTPPRCSALLNIPSTVAETPIAITVTTRSRSFMFISPWYGQMWTLAPRVALLRFDVR